MSEHDFCLTELSETRTIMFLIQFTKSVQVLFERKHPSRKTHAYAKPLNVLALNIFQTYTHQLWALNIYGRHSCFANIHKLLLRF